MQATFRAHSVTAAIACVVLASMTNLGTLGAVALGFTHGAADAAQAATQQIAAVAPAGRS